MRGLVVPERSEDFTADPVELFFDLAFVFAFTQLVGLLVTDPTWSGAGEATLLFGVIWLAWSTFTWAANAVSGNSREVRLIFLVATATSLPLGASIRSAFDSGGATFSIAGAIIIVTGIGLQLWGLPVGSPEFRSTAKFAIPNLIAVGFLILGGLFEGSTRTALWIAFSVVIIGSMIAAGSGDWIVRTSHFAERHGLIVIIALGEVVVAIGLPVVDSVGEGGLPGATVAGLIGAGVLVGLMWWSYFDRVLPALELRAETKQGKQRVRFARDIYTWLHFPIVGGIIVMAAAVEEILLHPSQSVPVEFRVMLAAGIALFYGGVVASVARAFGAVAKERLAAFVVVVAVVAVGRSWDGIVILFVIDGILLASLIAEHVRVESPHPADV